jgi:hypothetical protein
VQQGSANVGIGSTSPATTLSIFGNTYTTGGEGIGVLNTTAGALQTSGLITGGSTLILNGTTGTTTAGTGQGFVFGNNYLTVLGANGNVGINTINTVASTPLFVSGATLIGASNAKNQRANIGLTLDTNNSSTFSSNADIGDGSRQLTIANENSTANAFSSLSFRVNPGGGTSNAMLDIKFVDPNDGSNKLIYSFRDQGSFNDRFAMTSAGNLGIGTTTPWRTLSVTGTVGFDGITSVSTNQSAYLCLSSSKEVVQDSTTCLASSARFKQNITSLSASSSLAEVLALHPVSFQYTPAYNGSLQSDPNFSGTFVGFIAEDMAKVDPRLITIDATGTTPTAPHGVRYENVTAILAGAIQDIASISGVFKDSLIAWLADAGNGIEDLFAKNIYADNITTKELTFVRATGKQLCLQKSDGTAVCVNGDQLAAVLAGTNATASTPAPSGGSATPAPDTAPPTIAINGTNPAIIHVGDTYSDLGATITGPQADLNLGIRTYLNGAPVNTIQIGTTQVATDTIDYVVNDANGLTATSTRTVIVRAAEGAPSPTEVINPNVATTSPSTAATTAAQ